MPDTFAEYTRNGTTDTARTRSGFWADCPWEQIVGGFVDGSAFFDDFLDFGINGTQTSEINLGRYKVYNTGSGVVKADSMPQGTAAGQDGGVISMLCDTAGDQSVIGTHSCPFYLTTTRPNSRLWFEARIALTGVATNRSHVFVGLGNNKEVTFGAAIPLADADATGTAVNLIGFAALEDGLTDISTVLTDEGATYNYGGVASTNIQTSAGTLAANTWIKVGMKFDATDSARCVRFFVNGVECTTAVTKAILAATTHLDVSGLGPVFAQFADSAGTANYAYMDWWRIAQTF